jgi:hypothetical protein
MLPNFNNNGPCFELFSSATDILKFWKQKGKITKEFEPHSKSHIYFLQFGGVSMLSIPINEKHSLQINNNCLLFQFILFNNKAFSIEIGIRDKTDSKRRFNITSSVKEVDPKPLYVKIPINDYPLNIWTNLLIDVEALTQQYFKSQAYKIIDNVHITGCLKIRKIFSLRNKDEPVTRNVDMGKAIPLVNLFLVESGNIIKRDIKILGINSFTVNNVNINSNNIQAAMNAQGQYGRSNNSPISSNASKFSNLSDINLNRHKNYYRRSNENNNINIYKMNNNRHNSELEGIMNISPITNNIQDKKTLMENLAKKTKDNLKFANDLKKKNITNVKNDIKYGVVKKGGVIAEDFEGGNSSNKILNVKEKGKSLGKYVSKHQKNNKRNKSNNPYMASKINKNINENNDISGNVTNKNMSNKNIAKVDNNKNDGSVINNNKSKDKKISSIKNNNIVAMKQKELENKEESNNKDYYYKKDEEISMEDYQDSVNYKSGNEHHKYNNMPLSNSIVNKNSMKDNSNHKEKDTTKNKFSNYLLDSKELDFKNIPVYDSIEEVAEWNVDINNDGNNRINEGVEKMGDRLIQLESGNSNSNQNKDDNYFNDTGDNFLELSSLLKHKDTLRPYTPPIEELVQVNPNNIKGESNRLKNSVDKRNALMNTNRILRNYENLVYNQDKGLFYDPKTNIYYDIKAK